MSRAASSARPPPPGRGVQSDDQHLDGDRVDASAATTPPRRPTDRSCTSSAVAGRAAGGNSVANGFDTRADLRPGDEHLGVQRRARLTLAPLPQARGGMGKAVFYNGEFYVMGGETSTGAGATAKKSTTA